MTPSQIEQLQRALEARRVTLLDEIRRDAARARAEQYGEIAGRVTDAGDQSVAGLFVDINQAELARDVKELREIEAACRRLADGSYGACTDCGADIGLERLQAEPEAARCIDCQRRHEKTYRV